MTLEQIEKDVLNLTSKYNYDEIKEIFSNKNNFKEENFEETLSKISKITDYSFINHMINIELNKSFSLDDLDHFIFNMENGFSYKDVFEDNVAIKNNTLEYQFKDSAKFKYNKEELEEIVGELKNSIFNYVSSYPTTNLFKYMDNMYELGKFDPYLPVGIIWTNEKLNLKNLDEKQHMTPELLLKDIKTSYDIEEKIHNIFLDNNNNFTEQNIEKTLNSLEKQLGFSYIKEMVNEELNNVFNLEQLDKYIYNLDNNFLYSKIFKNDIVIKDNVLQYEFNEGVKKQYTKDYLDNVVTELKNSVYNYVSSNPKTNLFKFINEKVDSNEFNSYFPVRLILEEQSLSTKDIGIKLSITKDFKTNGNKEFLVFSTKKDTRIIDSEYEDEYEPIFEDEVIFKFDIVSANEKTKSNEVRFIVPNNKIDDMLEKFNGHIVNLNFNTKKSSDEIEKDIYDLFEIYFYSTYDFDIQTNYKSNFNDNLLESIQSKDSNFSYDLSTKNYILAFEKDIDYEYDNTKYDIFINKYNIFTNKNDERINLFLQSNNYNDTFYMDIKDYVNARYNIKYENVDDISKEDKKLLSTVLENLYDLNLKCPVLENITYDIVEKNFNNKNIDLDI